MSAPADQNFGQPRQVTDFTVKGWADPSRREARAAEDCRRLEAGEILYFPTAPFPFPGEDRQYLLGVRQTSTSIHKNIAYRPLQDKITGVEAGSADEKELHRILGGFSRGVVKFLSEYLFPYNQRWDLDYASFRPLQEQGRQNRISARNDLLHVDNFPTRPTRGNRILRVFININPDEGRKWITGEPMDVLAPKYAPKAGFEKFTASAKSPLRPIVRAAKGIVRGLGIKVPDRPPYDEFMLHLHHHMKHDEEYQKNCTRNYWEFPPGSAWLVYTDMVPHAVLSGQYALEQTFLVHADAQVTPEKAPIRILEKMAGFALADG